VNRLVWVGFSLILGCVGQGKAVPDVDDTDGDDTDTVVDSVDSVDDTVDSVPPGERVVHNDGGVYDSTGDFQQILRDSYVCYVLQQVESGRVNVVALGLEQRLRHIVAEGYVAPFEWIGEDLDYANIDLHEDEQRLLLTGSGGAFVVDLVTGRSDLVRAGNMQSGGAWVEDGVVLGAEVFATIQDALAGTVLYTRRETTPYLAGYRNLLYSSSGYDYSRETFAPRTVRTSHSVPTDLERQMRGATQFDVVGDVVVTRAVMDDFSEPLAWFDGKAPQLLGIWDPMLQGGVVPVACHAGRP
jgi:hypothetical protein